MSVRNRMGSLAIATTFLECATFAQRASAQPAVSSPPAGDTPAVPAQPATRQLRPQVDRHFASVPDDPGPLATDVAPAITQKAVGAAMHKVADWQLAQSQEYFTVFDRSRQLDGRIWTWGALYSGLMAASDSLGDPKYRNVMRDMGNTYQIGTASCRER